MPLQSTRGAGSAKGFGLTSGSKKFDVDYLVVAGGGGTNGNRSGGGGAGGYRTTFPGGTKITLSPGSTPITVGGGGAIASSGTDSIFSTITIDGSSTNVTLEYQGGSAPTAGNAGIDVYSFTAIKTATTPAYTILASQTQFN